MPSLSIANANVVKATGCHPATVLVDEGLIRAIVDSADRPEADEEIDARGRYLLPGVIDPHVHFGLSQSFGAACRTESEAAVAAGVTAVMHYLTAENSHLATYEEHASAVEKNSLIDVGFHCMIKNELQVAEIPRAFAELGIGSFKFHMAMKGPESAYGIAGVDDGLMFEGFQSVAQCPGALAIVHAENIDVILRQREAMRLAHPEATDIATWERYRPAFTEEEAISRSIHLARAAGVPLAIAHTSVGTGPAIAVDAQRNGTAVYVETCPQFLMLHTGMNLGVEAKMNPPIRSAANSTLLWQELIAGRVDWMGSDHCDYLSSDKAGSIWDAGPGLPSGMQMILPSLLDRGVRTGQLSIEEVVRLTSTNPARAFGLSGKGAIEVGNDADLIVVDTDLRRNITAQSLRGYSDFSPYEGLEVTGWPIITIVGGVVLYDHGELDSTTTRRGRVLLSSGSRALMQAAR